MKYHPKGFAVNAPKILDKLNSAFSKGNLALQNKNVGKEKMNDLSEAADYSAKLTTYSRFNAQLPSKDLFSRAKNTLMVKVIELDDQVQEIYDEKIKPISKKLCPYTRFKSFRNMFDKYF
jgi:hypothetical protein